MAEDRSSTISIHALREEGDLVGREVILDGLLFLSTPSARRATSSSFTSKFTSEFLSTPSARRATRGDSGFDTSVKISIHALREEGDLPTVPRFPSWAISIHALREEGDFHHQHSPALSVIFLSTPSARRATDQWHSALQIKEISIHALREEGDLVTFADTSIRLYFYPRPPRGGRHLIVVLWKMP